jgi:hypothetical protein
LRFGTLGGIVFLRWGYYIEGKINGPHCLGYDLIGHHPTMPCVGKTAHSVVTTCRLEDSLHTSNLIGMPRLIQPLATIGTRDSSDPAAWLICVYRRISPRSGL